MQGAAKSAREKGEALAALFGKRTHAKNKRYFLKNKWATGRGRRRLFGDRTEKKSCLSLRGAVKVREGGP